MPVNAPPTAPEPMGLDPIRKFQLNWLRMKDALGYSLEKHTAEE